MASVPQIQRVVVVGAVAGGATFAARARRLNEAVQITILDKGKDVSFANCGLPYYIGETIKDASRLALHTPESLSSLLKVDVRTKHEVVKIDRQSKKVFVKNDKGETEEFPYDKLVLSPGAAPLIPPIKGLKMPHPRIFTLRTLDDMHAIKSKTDQSQNVVVVGAGFIGLEMAEQLAEVGKKVTIVERVPQILPQMDEDMVVMMETELQKHGVRLLKSTSVNEVADTNCGNVELTLSSGEKLGADVVILSAGVRPESNLAKECGLELYPTSHIVTNEFQQTSDPDIYAVGDAVVTADGVFAQEKIAAALGGPANREGRVAADHMFHPSPSKYPGSLGTAIVRVFSVSAGVTGWTSRRLRMKGIEHEVTVITDYHHAGFYPGAQYLTLKVCWSKKDGKVLGAQAVGMEGVDKRLDVLATAIRGGLTIDDLAHLELAYAPPFGAAKDPVNVAGFVACNQRDGLVKIATSITKEDAGAVVVDVREPLLAEMHPILLSDEAKQSGVTVKNIPIGQLRARFAELDKSKPLITVCNLGKSSYFATRILSQLGFENVKSLQGGVKFHDEIQAKPKFTEQKISSSSSASSFSYPSSEKPVVQLDCRGLACPGPLIRLKKAVDSLKESQTLEVLATDDGFVADCKAFLSMNDDLSLVSIAQEEEKSGKFYKATIVRKGAMPENPAAATLPAAMAVLSANVQQMQSSSKPSGQGGAAIILFSQDYDKALASLVLANGAASMSKNRQTTVFCTFWGLNLLRKPANEVKDLKPKNWLDKMFGWMLPRGSGELPLSNMNFGGAGKKMMLYQMGSKNLPNCEGLLASARESGVRFVACSMSMDAMGIQKEELYDFVEIGGVAEYLAAARDSDLKLFI